jgi:phosphatidylethanolamine/phosphatidyl-N-methylethanolamine N-methyltransferase
MADQVLDLLGGAEPYLGAAQPWLERAVRVFALGEPVGRLPVPAALDAAAVLVRNGLTSRYFPLRLYNINLRDLALSRAIVVIAAAPLIWNFVAQAEYRTRVVSRILGKWVGAYVFALWIFCFSLYRDLLFLAALQSQPPSAVMLGVKFAVGGVAMYTVGFVLVASSMLRLGITGTYLGDYFGILMDAKVEAFPFNMFDNPMYDGATLCFLGKSFMYVK